MKKRFTLLLSMLLVLSVFLAACGAKDDAAPTKAQELTINISTEPPTLNPGLAQDSTSGNVLNQIFEGLTTPKAEGGVELAAAEDVKVSDDQLTYTFTLKDSKWSNGDPVTAQDFEYAWKWVLDPANATVYSYQLYYIKGAQDYNEGKGSVEDVAIKALDEKTLEVTLNNPTPYFLELPAFYTYFPVNSKIAQENPEWAFNAGESYVSNGPFKLTTWNHSSDIVVEKNENYWDAENVKLDKITMVMIKDENTALSMFNNGELDWTGNPLDALPTDSLKALKKDGKLSTQSYAGIYNYKFNTKVEPLNNANIRKALTLAIDRQSLIDNVVLGNQQPAFSIVPTSVYGDDSYGYFKDNDVETAKKYLEEGLKELGYASVDELPSITISYNTSEAHAKIAQSIQAMWSDNLGVKTELSNSEWGVYLDSVNSGDFQVARMGWSADFIDPINFLEMYYSANGGNNQTGWESARFQALLDQAAMEVDADKRMSLLQEAEAVFMEDMAVAPIYFNTDNWIKVDNLKGELLTALSSLYFKNAYFK